MSELILAYEHWRTQPLSDLVKISDRIFATRITNLTLQEYCWVRRLHCSSTHSNCTECSSMLIAADMILTEGIVPLSLVFRTAFPDVTYSAACAKTRLLQMPLVALRIGEPHSGKSQIYVMEYIHGINYIGIAHFRETSGMSHHIQLSARKS